MICQCLETLLNTAAQKKITREGDAGRVETEVVESKVDANTATVLHRCNPPSDADGDVFLTQQMHMHTLIGLQT